MLRTLEVEKGLFLIYLFICLLRLTNAILYFHAYTSAKTFLLSQPHLPPTKDIIAVGLSMNSKGAFTPGVRLYETTCDEQPNLITLHDEAEMS